MSWLPTLNQIALVTKWPRPGSSIRAMSLRICPRCGRSDIRPSNRRGIGDRILACIGLTPYRCRACRSRFFRFPLAQENEVDSVVEVTVQSAPVQPVVVLHEPIPPANSWPLLVHPLSHVPFAHSILIVSRDPAIRKLLSKVLAQPGYHTHQVADAADLPSELRARKVDLVVMDLDMPEQQGLEAVSALRNKYPNLKIIALSGLEVAGVPGSIVLPKPFRRELLIESVQSALVEASETRVSAIAGR